ncbi:MAG: iron-containing redox enzyme family protein [Actinomycetota bacterium]|nr:iron-containing redox enzyme family protein [Actinomycetota bacterium]
MPAIVVPMHTGLAEPCLPAPRGPLSAHVINSIRKPVHHVAPAPASTDDPLAGDDFQLALYVLYELHYRGFADVDEGWEWDPSLLAVRRSLESRFEVALLCEVGEVGRAGDDIASQLQQIINNGTGAPSLSAYMEHRGTLDQLVELSIHRSAYQLKEADPHTWAIPRLAGTAKAAMVEIQADEYGGGVAPDMHASLFADTMASLGLDTSYGAYLDRLPGTTLATVNLISLFGLHRRRRGAVVGHLAVFEMTSCEPMGRYSRALRRLGLGPPARRFYDVHVEADVHHAVVAANEMAAGLARAEPQIADDILFGGAALMAVESRFSEHMLAAFGAHRSSLINR